MADNAYHTVMQSNTRVPNVDRRTERRTPKPVERIPNQHPHFNNVNKNYKQNSHYTYHKLTYTLESIMNHDRIMVRCNEDSRINCRQYVVA